MSKVMNIEITPSGDIKANLEGFVGKECAGVMDKLQQLMGSDADVTNKPEFSHGDAEQAVQKERLIL